MHRANDAVSSSPATVLGPHKTYNEVAYYMRGAKALLFLKKPPFFYGRQKHRRYASKVAYYERERCKKLLFLKVTFLGPFLWASRPYDQRVAII